MRAFAVILVVFIFLSFRGEPEKSSVAVAVKAFVNDPALKNAGIGFSMKEVSSGALVYKYNSQQSLVPASVMKLVTTYAALKVLGDDYRFATTLGYTGSVDSAGILHGRFIIKGGGDPTLGSGRLQGTGAEQLINLWTNSIRKAGIKDIDGIIQVDDRRYDDSELPREWLLEDVSNYYGALPSGLNFGENLYKVILKPGSKVGDPVKLIQIEPQLSLEFTNQLKTGAVGSGDNAYILVTNSGSHVIQGTIPAGKETFTIKGAHTYPPVMCVELLRESLGWKSHGPLYDLEDTVVVQVSFSPTLSEIINETNQNSINLYAETLLREMGYTYSGGKPGTTENGVKAVFDLLRREGISSSGFVMKDGCGLARSNAINAAFLVDLLQKGYASKAFYNSLPVAGQSGAMKNMGKGTAIEGNMRAKTGHMERVRSYAGYVKGKDGKIYCFALIVNNYNCSSAEIKQKIEKLLVALGNLP